MDKRFPTALKGGDLRSIGNANKVVRRVAKDPRLFEELFECMLHGDRIVRMRAADAVEKATREHPQWLQPWKRCLLDDIAGREEKELRWHVAQLLPRLRLSAAEKKRAVNILLDYLRDKSSIVRTFSMQALADLSVDDPELRETVYPLIERLTCTGTAAMKARGRKLMREFDGLRRT